MRVGTLEDMTDAVRNAFAQRLHEICDDLKLPAERGRQTALAKLVGLTPNAARKWLQGDGLPEMAQAVKLAAMANVSVVWLLQGSGPKRDTPVDTKALILDEALHALPTQDAQQVFDFIEYKFQKVDGVFAGERLARYMKMLDAFKQDMNDRDKA